MLRVHNMWVLNVEEGQPKLNQKNSQPTNSEFDFLHTGSLWNQYQIRISQNWKFEKYTKWMKSSRNCSAITWVEKVENFQLFQLVENLVFQLLFL